MTDLTKAPGCYGAASIHNPDNEVCQGCAYLVACGDESRATLNRLRERMNVSDLLTRLDRKPLMAVAKPTVPVARVAPVQAAPAMPAAVSPVAPARVTPMIVSKVELSTEEVVNLANLPVKPRELAERLLRSGRVVSIQRDVQAGRNPFATAKPEFLRVAFDALLAGGCSRSALKQRFQDQLGWSEGTASSHVGIVTALLPWLGVASVSGDRMEMKR